MPIPSIRKDLEHEAAEFMAESGVVSGEFRIYQPDNLTASQKTICAILKAWNIEAYPAEVWHGGMNGWNGAEFFARINLGNMRIPAVFLCGREKIKDPARYAQVLAGFWMGEVGRMEQNMWNGKG